MPVVILFLVVGSALVYISKFNFAPVTVNLGVYIFSGVPLFYVIVASVLFGLIVSYLVYLVDFIFSSFVLNGKNNEIKKNKEKVLELTKQVHQLEIKNSKLNNGVGIKSEDPNAL